MGYEYQDEERASDGMAKMQLNTVTKDDGFQFKARQ